MVTIRQSVVKSFTRFYPFYSGCGTLANHSMIEKMAGVSNEVVWTNIFGSKILAPLDDYIGRAAYYCGELDRKISWICDRIVRPGDTVLDIGANIGMVTLLLSKLVGENGNVHSFEPNPKIKKMLEETLAHNQVSNVCLHPIALGEEQGLLELRIPSHNAGAASLIRNINSRDIDLVEVPVCPLSDIITEKGIESIRLIKIDVEGFEAQVLRGGRKVLESIRPEAILFELNGKIEGSVANQPVIKILRDLGYAFFSIPRCFVRMHLNSFDPDMSHQLIGHDFLAVPEESYEKMAKLVRAC